MPPHSPARARRSVRRRASLPAARPAAGGESGRALAALAALAAVALLVSGAGCGGREVGRGVAESAASPAVTSDPPSTVAADARDPDDDARMLNPEPPFRYPPELYAKRVQGNVLLRLWVDSAGQVLPESTQVAEPSGYVSLDSAAVRGSEQLRFAPAMRDGRPVAASVLFPVHFRHPEAAPLPGDTPVRVPTTP